MLDTFLGWCAVILPTAISALGVWISMKPPGSAIPPQWRWGLIAFGVLVSGLVFWQQSRSRTAQSQSQSRIQDALDKSQKELQAVRMDHAQSSAFLSGQVAALTQLAANPPRNADFAAMATALTELANNPASLREETNQELRSQVSDLSRRLREFQTRMTDESNRRSDEWMAHMQAARGNREEMNKIQQQEVAFYSQASMRNLTEFGPLRAEALALQQKMLKRIQNPPDEKLPMVQMATSTLRFGNLAGAYPVAELAAYLETLAQLLPVKR